MAKVDACIEAFSSWFDSLNLNADGYPARGNIGAAMVLLERLKEEFDLDIASHRAPRGTQIIGATPDRLSRLLSERFLITKTYVGDGIRTNRGNIPVCEALLDQLRTCGAAKLSESHREALLNRCQELLAENVRAWLNQLRIAVEFNPEQTLSQNIQKILEVAHEAQKDGAVAQHLVGAKLQLRFPELSIENESFTTADAHLGRHGDFIVNDTAFHVTVSPNTGHYDKCVANLKAGARPYLLVPERRISGTKETAQDTALGKISVGSIESFVAQNIEEIGTFARDSIGYEFKRLLDLYNKRVDQAEVDKSLLLEIPTNL